MLDLEIKVKKLEEELFLIQSNLILTEQAIINMNLCDEIKKEKLRLLKKMEKFSS